MHIFNTCRKQNMCSYIKVVQMKPVQYCFLAKVHRPFSKLVDRTQFRYTPDSLSQRKSVSFTQPYDHLQSEELTSSAASGFLLNIHIIVQNRCAILDKGKRFFLSSSRLYLLWVVPSLFSNRYMSSFSIVLPVFN
jgi:hypothetical protein